MTNRQARRDQARAARTQRSRTPSQRPQQRRSSGGGGGGLFSTPYVVGVGALVLVLAGVLLFLALRGGDDGGAQAQRITDSLAAFPADMADGNAVGDPGAPITLIAYEDFRCPFCLGYTADEEPGIFEEYVKTGKVRYEFRNFAILGTESVNAGRAVQCALKQDKFWEMHHTLYIEAAKRGGSSDAPAGTFSADALKGYASDIGLDRAAFDACYDNNETLEEVNTQIGEARSYGFTGTPSFLLNGAPISGGGPSDMEGWRTLFDGLLNATPTAEASGTPAATTTGTPAASQTPSATATP